MAGSNIYLEPIISNAVAGIPVMVQEMQSMVQEMQQSTRILSNILSNTGLTQSQKAFSGSDLSAETMNVIEPLSNTNVNSDMGSIKSKNSINGSAVSVSNAYNFNFDLTNYSAFTGKITPNANAVAYSVCIDGTEVYRTETLYTYSSPVNFNIDISSYSGIKTINFKADRSGAMIIDNLSFDDNTNVFNCYGKIGFGNSNQIIKTFDYPLMNNCDNVTSGYIDFTGSITGASLWSSVIINGNLTGVTMSIIDSTTLEKIMDLPASINDISTLTQLTNFSIKFEFGEGSEDSYISAVIFRYY